MITWLEEIEKEFARAAEAERSGNEGKVRTSARRAVGIAVAELQKRFPEKIYGRDFISQIRSLAQDGSVPPTVRSAADRLQAKLSPAFESPSVNPIGDAQIIIRFIVEQMA